MFYLVYEELLARHSGIYQYTVTIISNVKPKSESPFPKKQTKTKKVQKLNSKVIVSKLIVTGNEDHITHHAIEALNGLKMNFDDMLSECIR